MDKKKWAIVVMSEGEPQGITLKENIIEAAAEAQRYNDCFEGLAYVVKVRG
jgi:hypothetical protein